jgi:hypothetical protein
MLASKLAASILRILTGRKQQQTLLPNAIFDDRLQS